MSSTEFIKNRVIAKGIVRLVVGHCVADTVTRIVKKVADYEEMSKREKLVVNVGAKGLGGAAAYGTAIYTDALIDDIYDVAFGEERKVIYDDENIIIINEEK